MPTRALRPCPRPGCTELVRLGRCPRHQAEADTRERARRAAADRARPSITARGYGSRWRKASQTFLAKPGHERCALVQPRCSGRATVVDHRIPWRSGATPEEQQRLFWDTSNWQPACASCHSSKTAREDGGFGNPRRGGGATTPRDTSASRRTPGGVPISGDRAYNRAVQSFSHAANSYGATPGGSSVVTDALDGDSP